MLCCRLQVPKKTGSNKISNKIPQAGGFQEDFSLGLVKHGGRLGPVGAVWGPVASWVFSPRAGGAARELCLGTEL